MNQISEFILPIVQKVNAYLSDYILIILLVGAGLLFTFATKFVQIRCFGEGMKKVFGNISLKGGKNKSGLSSFQALATAVAAQVGTGNIVGASGAILVGGPGAIFWMWIIAFLGMATIYAEAILAQETRIVDDNGQVHGGPVYYIRKAYKGGFGKFLAGFFAVAITLALGFMGCMVQSNSIAESCSNAFGIKGWIVGIILAILSAIIFLGGVNRLASVTEKLVPIMAVVFLIFGFIVLGIRFKYIPETFAMIFKYAFTPNALIGGGIGYAVKTAISQGAKRGLFSNEAGMGSTPHAHAQANVAKPHDQGVVAMIGVFIDTFVVLTMTALVVISCLFTGNGPLASANGTNYAEVLANSGITKTNAMQTAFGNAIGNSTVGSIFVALCLLFFAFSTILSWNFFGKINVQYLFKNNKIANAAYSVIGIGFIFLGTLLSNDLVWELTDFFNYLMVIPNVMALVPLCAIVVKASKSNKESILKK
ncbi:MAG: sodium:alanine symporter family protein [Acutalibacteraceae bacterium]|nr:sodium:alanine symporter family protein [Acutalibacteraceae bacterium]